MANVCRTCNGQEFTFEKGPCKTCNPMHVGFAIELKPVNPKYLEHLDPEEEREASLWGIAEAIADSFIEVGRAIKRTY